MATTTSISSANGGRSSGTRRVLASVNFIPADNPALKDQLTTALEAHLPLADLHWKSSSRGTTRIIDSLNLELRDYRDVVLAGNTSTNLLERPYLHILFVGSDDNEAYRVTLRPQIKEWIDSLQALSSKRSSALEWLIVHVTAQKTGPSKFYQRKGSVYDKVRADFNNGKKDRCVQLPLPGSLPPDSEDSKTAWNDLLARIKRNIVDSFDINFSSYEEDVRKVDQQRQLPGWNFCTFFVLKEGLAHAFESMNLLEDSLVQYDELEASYSLSGKDQALPWFSRLGGQEPGDDSLSILNAQSKPFRELIAKNEISIFDFRIYLFSRQASLVCTLGRVNELASRAKPFVYSMTRLLRAHGGALQKHFMEIWIYSAALEVVAMCRKLLHDRHNNMNPAAIPDLLPTLAELLELACRQVEKLGMAFGYLPSQHPFLMSTDLPVPQTEEEAASPTKPEDFKCSNTQLRGAMANAETFDARYRGLLQEAIDAWSGSLRTRSANKLRGSIAALEQARQHTTQAETIYSSLSTSFSHTRWNAIEAQLLRQASVLQGSLQRTKDQLLSVLALLRSGMDVGSLTWASSRVSPQTTERERQIAQDLIGQVKELSGSLQKEFAAVNFPTFAVKLNSENGGFPDEEDGVTVDVQIDNLLPCDVLVDAVRLKLASAATQQNVWLQAASCVLAPGRNSVRTQSPITVTGTYSLELSQIRLSRIIFQYSHRPASSTPLNTATAQLQNARRLLAQNSQPIVNFGHDPQGVDISIEPASELHLDRRRQLTVRIKPGRGPITVAGLRLTPPQGRLRFHLETARLLGKGTLNVHDGGFDMSEMDASSPIEITVEYEVLTEEPIVTIGASFEYRTSSQPDVNRSFITSLPLRLALPLAVNVQDFIRDKCIMSRFTISTDSRDPLRIQSAELLDSGQYTAESAVKGRPEAALVKADAPAGFFYKISKRGTATENGDAKMHLKLSYRTIADESRLLLLRHVETIFAQRKVPLSRKLKETIVSHLLASGKIKRPDPYRTESPLVFVGGFDAEDWKKRLRGYFDAASANVWARLTECMAAVFSEVVDMGQAQELPWQQLHIPFEPPTCAIYNHVSITFPEGKPTVFKNPLRVGSLASIVLSIKTSYQWACPEDIKALQSSAYEQAGRLVHRMIYEVVTKNDDWIVAHGRKRGEFHIEVPAAGATADPSVLSVELSIAPLRTGKLFLPSVSVSPLPPLLPGSSEPDYSQYAHIPGMPSCEIMNVSAGVTVEVLEAVSQGSGDANEDGLGSVSFWIDRETGESGPLPI